MARIYKYTTLRGLLANCEQMNAGALFGSGRAYKNGRGCFSFELSEQARKEAAELFASYLYSKGARRAEVAEGLREGWGDLSLFQCFYFSYKPGRGVWCSNSLSGEAFEYCRRKYLRG